MLTPSGGGPLKGIPIGNLTSQIFANIYMNELDQFVKHELKIRYYARYTDDFVIVSQDEKYLKKLIYPLGAFLNEKLCLSLHPNKVHILRYHRGVDFLGYTVFPHHSLVRKKTEKRIFRKIKERISEFKIGRVSEDSLNASLRSYLGVFSHADAYKKGQDLINKFWFLLKE